MHGFQNKFSLGFNRRHGRTGSLWQGGTRRSWWRTKAISTVWFSTFTSTRLDPDAVELESSWHPFELANDEPLEVDAGTIHVDVQGRTTDLERPSLDASQFVRRVCELAGFDAEHLVSRARDRETASRRRLIVTLGVERWRQKGSALASVLKKNPDVVSWWVGEGIRRRLEDDDFAEKIDRLDEALSKMLTQNHG